MVIPKRKRHKATEVARTLEWILTAFILAFVFRAFFMEAFRIPTGSMAPTLRGDHYRLACHQCGYEFDYGFTGGRKRSITTRCPSCGYYQALEGSTRPTNGDRILVLKSIYQFVEPKRWDVIVFKNPPEPNINYIKRLIGKPGEKVEIIDGDVYINDEIARKPEKVQEELWMPVYNHDHLPARPNQGHFNGHFFRMPFKNISDSNWKLKDDNPTRFVLEGDGDKVHSMYYDTELGNDFKAAYAYNDVARYSIMELVSDIKVSYYVFPGAEPFANGVELSKYGVNYRGWLTEDGVMRIDRVSGGSAEILAKRQIDTGGIEGKPVNVSFVNLDHQLELTVGGEVLVYDLGVYADSAGERNNIEPAVKIFGSGRQELAHVEIHRDIHYTSNSRQDMRGVEGNPVFLKEDQFFAAGDNSPESSDSRLWTTFGIGNKGKRYDKGIVPREYLIGKAVCVYWPGGYKPIPGFPLAIIPDFGDMKFIYGGK